LPKHDYLLALGSNVRHVHHGSPHDVIRAAMAALNGHGLKVRRMSPIIQTAPLGPSRRRFANAAVLVCTEKEPPELLARLQKIERKFGRKRIGSQWRARVLDIDIALWSGGAWASKGLIIPHIALRKRDFVLRPALSIAPDWRDPLTGLTIRHLTSRLTRHLRMPR